MQIFRIVLIPSVNLGFVVWVSGYTGRIVCLHVDKIQRDLQEVGDSFCFAGTPNKNDNRFYYPAT